MNFACHTYKSGKPESISGAGSHFFKPKLSVNNPDDQYEREANAVSDKVMRMEGPGVQLKPLPVVTSIQRKCEHCEEEDKKLQVKKQREKKQKPIIY